MTLKEVQVSDKETVFNVPVEIPDEDTENLITVGDVKKYIEEYS